MKVIIWGTGRAIENVCSIINFQFIECFVDSDAQKRLKGKIYGKEIIAPEDISLYSYDYLVIGSSYYWNEIAHICIFEYGIDCAKIVNLKMFVELCGKSTITDVEYLLAINEGKRLINRKIGGYSLPDLFCEKETTNILQNCFNSRGYLVEVSTQARDDLSIFQVGHKNFIPIGNSGYLPIGVGAFMDVPLRDSIGISIAHLNSVINECTAIYWVWKNYKCCIVGFNHYRRVLGSKINCGWPLQAVEVDAILCDADVIVAEPVCFGKRTIPEVLATEVTYEAFYESYRILQDIISRLDLESKIAFNEIMSYGIMYPCNMFVMRWELFNEYCQWLFDIILPMTERVEIKQEWDEYSKRIIGFWAERLLTVWLYKKKLKVFECPILLLDEGKPFGKS